MECVVLANIRDFVLRVEVSTVNLQKNICYTV